MKDLCEIERRLFLTQLCAVAATAALIGSSLKAETPAAGTQEDAPNTHNMLVFGEKAVYLSHLPMFDGLNTDKKGNVIKDKDGKTEYASPHRYQVILEASFHRGAKDLQNIYSDDRRKNPSVRIYTLNPKEFVLSKLASGNPPLTGFKAKVFCGHFERSEHRLVLGLDDVEVKVNRVVHFRKFNPQAVKPAELKYLLFGSAQETFLAHYISQPPDFDQMLSVKVEGHSFTDAELGKGIEVTIPGRPNEAGERVQEAQQVTGVTQPTGARALEFKLEANKEIYFEEGELLVSPTFEDTKLEKKGIRSAPDKSSDARRKTGTFIKTRVVNAMLPFAGS
jgi:hypothetical protein